jgi:hypothetical protein
MDRVPVELEDHRKAEDAEEKRLLVAGDQALGPIDASIIANNPKATQPLR